jgi:hypothetical protein
MAGPRVTDGGMRMGRPRSAHEVLAGIRTCNAAAGDCSLSWCSGGPAADRQVGRSGIGVVPREAGTETSEISARNSAHAVLVVRRT